MSGESRKTLDDELLREIRTRAEFIKEASRNRVDINIDNINVAIFITVAEGELIKYPIYVDEFVPENELLVHLQGSINGRKFNSRANIIVSSDDIKLEYASPPDVADVKPEELEKDHLKDELEWKTELWDIVKAIIKGLVIAALKVLLNIDP